MKRLNNLSLPRTNQMTCEKIIGVVDGAIRMPHNNCEMEGCFTALTYSGQFGHLEFAPFDVFDSRICIKASFDVACQLVNAQRVKLKFYAQQLNLQQSPRSFCYEIYVILIEATRENHVITRQAFCSGEWIDESDPIN